jgi:hypothetical protein
MRNGEGTRAAGQWSEHQMARECVRSGASGGGVGRYLGKNMEARKRAMGNGQWAMADGRSGKASPGKTKASEV